MTSQDRPEAWSEPVSDDDAQQKETSPVDEGGRAGVASTTTPESGLADPGPEVPGTDVRPRSPGHQGHDEPPPDDERAHPADFAPDGYDDRQEDARPDSARETPDEVADR